MSDYHDQGDRQPPEEWGERLAAFPRRGGRDRPDAELRVTLNEYNGHKFLSLRIWEQNQAGVFWPARGKGLSIRLGEAAELANVLRRVAALADDQGDQRPARADQARGPDRRQHQRQPDRSPRLPECDPSLPPGTYTDQYSDSF
jgi:hypothetical protein